MKDTNSLSHTSYRCKYHIVIILKYRRLTIYNKLRRDIIEILTLLINRKPDVKIIEGSLSRTYTYASGGTAKICSIGFYGVSEIEININDI